MGFLTTNDPIIYKPNAWYNKIVVRRCFAILTVVFVTFVVIFLTMYSKTHANVWEMNCDDYECKVFRVQVSHKSFFRSRKVVASLCDFLETCEPNKKYFVVDKTNNIKYEAIRADIKVTIGEGINWFTEMFFSEKQIYQRNEEYILLAKGHKI